MFEYLITVNLLFYQKLIVKAEGERILKIWLAFGRKYGSIDTMMSQLCYSLVLQDTLKLNLS